MTIKFRGKRIDNGEWVYGYYVKDYYHTFITVIGKKLTYNLRRPYRVIPETVGQYTLLKDRNNKKIYQGDIVKLYFIDSKEIEYSIQDVVIFKYGCFRCEKVDFPLYFYDIEVIGNVFENDLLIERL